MKGSELLMTKTAPKIEIYTRPACPYCAQALALLDAKSVTYSEIVVSNNPALREEMNARSKRNTFPQIFINDQHIGGCDDIMDLERRGGLDPLLAH